MAKRSSRVIPSKQILKGLPVSSQRQAGRGAEDVNARHRQIVSKRLMRMGRPRKRSHRHPSKRLTRLSLRPSFARTGWSQRASTAPMRTSVSSRTGTMRSRRAESPSITSISQKSVCSSSAKASAPMGHAACSGMKSAPSPTLRPSTMYGFCRATIFPRSHILMRRIYPYKRTQTPPQSQSSFWRWQGSLYSLA